MTLLSNINSPEDVKKLSEEELPLLCTQLRQKIVNTVAENGGHLAASLGAVELIVAIHRVFDTAKDRLVFDVGHQAYAHKLLTGRKDSFKTLRTFDGLSGFPKPVESIHDAFIAGHASNSVSVALGMCRARTAAGEDYNVISLMGDGALSGGLAYEALSDLGESDEKQIVILNDNGMSIMPSVGGMARHLGRLRIKPSYRKFKKKYHRVMEVIPGGKAVYKFLHAVKTAIKQSLLHCSFFEDLGLDYVGPVDGHDIAALVEALKWAQIADRPVVVHVITKKGKGYGPSEATPDKYHGVSGFDPVTGKLPDKKPDFSARFGEEMIKMASEDKRVCAITAAMGPGTGLFEYSKRYPDRFYDVGIAEGHAASMAAGMAAVGGIPVFAVYSTFLQRSYDMLIHDIAISGHHVVLAVDRAGLVGEDGETHHGVFDVSYLRSVPGLKIYCPASFDELSDMLRHSVFTEKGPVAVRYPRGGEGEYKDSGCETLKVMKDGGDVTIVTYGTLINNVLKAVDILREKGINAEVIKLGCIAPIDMEAVKSSVMKTGRLAVIEEVIEDGCVGESISSALLGEGVLPKSVVLKNLGSSFAAQGSVAQLYKKYGLDPDSIAADIAEAISHE